VFAPFIIQTFFSKEQTQAFNSNKFKDITANRKITLAGSEILMRKRPPKHTDMVRVLIVNSNTAYCQALGKILRSGFPSIAIKEAHDGVTGLEKTKAFLPHLVFMDPHLLKRDKLELISKIKNVNTEVIVIIFADYDLPEYKAAIHQSGADYFFQKDSWAGEEILALVHSVLTKPDIVLSNVLEGA